MLLFSPIIASKCYKVEVLEIVFVEVSWFKRFAFEGKGIVVVSYKLYTRNCYRNKIDFVV
jgi:hypothetical protein